jgi:sigma-B regulation protein RsbU (phosphoserine phosphatase)
MEPGDFLVLLGARDARALRMQAMLLTRQGYRVETAATGTEVLGLAGTLEPDLLLLDNDIPDGDGVSLCRQLRGDAKTTELPIILLVPAIDRELRLLGLKAGVDDFIAQPVDQVELSVRVNAALRMNRYRRALKADQLAKQLEMASAVQQLLLPRRAPAIDGLDQACSYQPAAWVGGDLYDVVATDDAVYTVVADVSGHGVASAIFMANVHSALRILVPLVSDPVALIEAINERVVEDAGDSGMFVSMVVARYDRRTRELQVVNCGHPEPVVIREHGQVDLIPASGPPLGMLAPLGVTTWRDVLSLGSSITFYTDGVSEASNARREHFGVTRLCDTLAASTGPAALAIHDVVEAVRTFCGSDTREDDMTIVMMRGVGHEQ